MNNNNETVEIMVQKSKLNGKEGYRWAWKESAEKKVYGFSTALDEIERKAKIMFPNNNVVLLVL